MGKGDQGGGLLTSREYKVELSGNVDDEELPEGYSSLEGGG
jgi:hypothetical protein